MTLRIKIKKGHLTATDKKVVRQLISNELKECGYKGTDYYIDFRDGIYYLEQVKMTWDCDFMRNKKVRRTSESEFTI
tara:strand:+ start:126 stop:356 length:231 start_codon:yes stop_codon:yes gene_type:complete